MFAKALLNLQLKSDKTSCSSISGLKNKQPAHNYEHIIIFIIKHLL